MVDKTQFDPQNPYALFDPTQWSNAYSNFNNAALPWPSRYVGMPNDAMGNPIAPPAGTTINSAPQPAPAPAAPAAATPSANNNLLYAMGNNLTGNAPGNAANNAVGQSMMAQSILNRGGGQQQAAAPAAAPTQQPGTVDYNSVLSMLANPGKVTTPGATVPATAPATANPAGLQSFLANWRPAQSGPGSGFQQGFAGALKGMGY